MTNQDKIKYLKRYKRLEDRISFKLEECERWKERAKKITPSYADTPKVHSPESKIESAVENLDELEREMSHDLAQLVELKRKIQAAIDCVPDDRLQALLERRYLKGCTFEQIADDMHYDWRHIHRLHGKALDVIECHI